MFGLFGRSLSPWNLLICRRVEKSGFGKRWKFGLFRLVENHFSLEPFVEDWKAFCEGFMKGK